MMMMITKETIRIRLVLLRNKMCRCFLFYFFKVLCLISRIPNVALGTKPHCSSVWFSSVKNSFVPMTNKSKSNGSFLRQKKTTRKDMMFDIERIELLFFRKNLFDIFYGTSNFHFDHITLLTIMRTNTKCTEWKIIINISFVFTYCAEKKRDPFKFELIALSILPITTCCGFLFTL